jgi:hypothetical protein
MSEKLTKIILVDLTDDNPREKIAIVNDEELNIFAQYEACGLIHVQEIEKVGVM